MESVNLSDEEQVAFFKIVESLTGTCQTGIFKKDLLLNNLVRRLNELNFMSFPEYILLVSEDDAEYDRFLSLMTIHTTSWFREKPHFDLLINLIEERLKGKQGAQTIQVWTAACSTGQEAYSIAVTLEGLRLKYPQINYKVHASDIDPVSVAVAEAGIYEASSLSSIPVVYHSCFSRVGSSIKINDSIKSKMSFFTASLLDIDSTTINEKMDFIFCRNVLIYFDKAQCETIAKNFSQCLNPNGSLILGHSERIEAEKFGFSLKKFSSYEWRPQEGAKKRGHKLDFGLQAKFMKCPDLIVIGASTGGPNILGNFLKNMPRPCPPIVLVQHINSDFAGAFARSMASASGLKLVATDTAVELMENCIYLAQGDYHLTVKEVDSKRFISPNYDGPMNSHRPSVDKLFLSVSQTNIPSIGVLLTGMGKDGAEGLLAMRRSGSSATMAQSKESCIVYGMPKEAIEMGAAQVSGSDQYLSQVLRSLIEKKFEKAG